MAEKKASLIRWQLPMQRVLYAVTPLCAFGIYLFGWRVLVMLVLANAAGFLTEYAFTRKWKEPVTSAVFVTATLLVLSLPPALPLWMAVLGVVFAVVFGKMVFGGFGRNVFNPALTGRAFLYICFGRQMTSMWSEPFTGTGGGFAAYGGALDAITQATPGMLIKSGAVPDLWASLVGTTSGTIGGTSALLALLGGGYLLWTKTASYRIVVSGLASFLILQAILWAAGVQRAAEPLHALLNGSFVVGMLFYATDPVSASQTNAGRWLYGAFIGALSCLIAIYSTWPAGTMFAILLANMFAPITDYALKTSADRTAKP